MCQTFSKIYMTWLDGVTSVWLIQDLLNKAILASVAARREWDLKPIQDRAQVLFKAADIISGPKRAEILAKTMIGQVQWTI